MSGFKKERMFEKMFNKCRTFLILTLGAFILIGCQAQVQSSPSDEKGSNNLQDNTPTVLLQTIQATIQPSQTKEVDILNTVSIPILITLTATTENPLFIEIPSGLRERGELRFRLESLNEFKIISLENGKVETISLDSEERCYLLNDKVTALCGTEGKAWIHNIVDDSIKNLPFVPPYFWRITNNRKFVYSFSENKSAGKIVQIYDLIQGKITDQAFQYETNKWIGAPHLSSDGNHLIGAWEVGPNDSRLFELSLGDTVPEQIGPNKPLVTGNLAWAPSSPLLLYGVQEGVETEIGFCTTQLMLLNLEPENISQVGKGPKKCFEDFGKNYQSIWSLDETKVAVTTPENSMCISDIEGGSQKCYTVTSDDTRIGAFAWSPGSFYVVFTTFEASHNKKEETHLLDVESGEIIDLPLGFLDVNSLEWH